MANKLVRNEQRKLTASYMNGLAMAFFGVGGFAPMVAMTLSGLLAPTIHFRVVGCMFASLGLHLLARQTLDPLEE